MPLRPRRGTPGGTPLSREFIRWHWRFHARFRFLQEVYCSHGVRAMARRGNRHNCFRKNSRTLAPCATSGPAQTPTLEFQLNTNA